MNFPAPEYSAALLKRGWNRRPIGKSCWLCGSPNAFTRCDECGRDVCLYCFLAAGPNDDMFSKVVCGDDVRELGCAYVEPLRCHQGGCTEAAAYRFTWPGQDENLICERHSQKVQAAAAALGMHLQLIPLQQDPRSEQHEKA